ncbi:hypothetical protein PMIN04_004006 [Paraphaeosphaeria minitans]
MTSDATALLQTKNGGRFGRALRKEFLFEEGYVNLNHGSFGTYPRAIRDVFRTFQDAHEARPDDFIRYQYPKHNDEARQALSKYLDVPTRELVFVPNATTGVNTVLRSLIFAPNEYILYGASIYDACEKAVAYVTETTPARAARIEYAFPVEDEWLVSAFAAKMDEIERGGGKVRVAVFDTVVSIPGVRLPFERIVQVCRDRGVLSLVDGAHGIGHVPLNLRALDADFFVSNCHKYVSPSRTEEGKRADMYDVEMAARPPRLRNLPRPAPQPTPHPLHAPHIPRLRALPLCPATGPQEPPSHGQRLEIRLRAQLRIRRHHRRVVVPVCLCSAGMARVHRRRRHHHTVQPDPRKVRGEAHGGDPGDRGHG